MNYYLLIQLALSFYKRNPQALNQAELFLRLIFSLIPALKSFTVNVNEPSMPFFENINGIDKKEMNVLSFLRRVKMPLFFAELIRHLSINKSVTFCREDFLENDEEGRSLVFSFFYYYGKDVVEIFNYMSMPEKYNPRDVLELAKGVKEIYRQYLLSKELGSSDLLRREPSDMVKSFCFENEVLFERVKEARCLMKLIEANGSLFFRKWKESSFFDEGFVEFFFHLLRFKPILAWELKEVKDMIEENIKEFYPEAQRIERGEKRSVVFLKEGQRIVIPIVY